MIAENLEVAVLIGRAKERDSAAFADLYRATIKPVYRYLSAHLSSPEDAEEATQEVFLAALAGLPTLRAETEVALMKWLLQIARNKAADHLRRRYRRPVTLLDEAQDVESPEPRPDQVALVGDDQARVRAALARLTPDQREVINCKYVLGYDNERTAALVGKNVNAVNQLHHRALASLHRFLQPAAEVHP